MTARTRSPQPKCHLSVNINKIATLRNSRGGTVPNVVQCAVDIMRFGAEGITVHPRPDERHIRKTDVYDLQALLKKTNAQRPKNKKIEFNIEGYPSQDFLNLIQEVRPDQATLVPDPPNVITSNAGWKVSQTSTFLKNVLAELRQMKVRSALFIDVFAWSDADTQALARLRPDRVELYTERFATDYNTAQRARTTSRYAEVTNIISALGIGINAGHDLSLQNVRYLLKQVPQIVECSIGHALIAESLYMGFEKTIKQYLSEMQLARG